MTEKSRVVYFAHGKESGPWGLKIKVLAEIAKRHGFVVHSPDYTDTFDPQARIDRLRGLLAQEPQDGVLLLVGSSMGGYVSAFAADDKIDGLFLMAPALYMDGYAGEPSPPPVPIAVVHGWQDNIVPPANAVRFAERHSAALLMLDAEHALNEVVDEIGRYFEVFLSKCLQE